MSTHRCDVCKTRLPLKWILFSSDEGVYACLKCGCEYRKNTIVSKILCLALFVVLNILVPKTGNLLNDVVFVTIFIIISLGVFVLCVKTIRLDTEIKQNRKKS